MKFSLPLQTRKELNIDALNINFTPISANPLNDFHFIRRMATIFCFYPLRKHKTVGGITIIHEIRSKDEKQTDICLISGNNKVNKVGFYIGKVKSPSRKKIIPLFNILRWLWFVVIYPINVVRLVYNNQPFYLYYINNNIF